MKSLLFGALGAFCLAGAAQAATLEITVTNLSSPGGVTVTPVFSAFHDGSFDMFDPGAQASAAVQAVAETGNSAGVAAELGGAGVSTVIATPGIPPIEPGEVAVGSITVDGTSHRYFSYLSMILPSNDQFIGNGDPLAFELFDAAGNFLGPRTITVTGLNAYDAGTEQNTVDGAPFVQGNDPAARMDENGVITQAPGIDNFAGFTVANGQVIDLSQINFANNADFGIATIQISEVPVPGALPLLAGGLMLLGAMRRRA